jgi:hypothetical protein
VTFDRSKFKAVNRTTEGRELLPAQARITDPGRRHDPNSRPHAHGVAGFDLGTDD